MRSSAELGPDGLRSARKRLVQMHYESGVGHLGGNLSALDALLLVFHEFLGPDDKFILSKGHSAGALYTALWSCGRLTDDDLKTFHKDDTLLSGHPPASGLADVLFATGSLGHGLSLAAGTALALRLKSQTGRVVCMTSDGEWQEGSTWEALIFACHHRLETLTILVDHNDLQGFGSTSDVASMSPLWTRLQGFELQVEVIDGHDLAQIRSALAAPQTGPRLIALRTIKGRGLQDVEGRMESHYLPLDATGYTQAMHNLDSQ